MRLSSMRSSLLRELLLIVVALGAAIFGTAWFGARALLEDYAPLVVHQMLARTEERLASFLEPVRNQVRQIAAWGRNGRIPLGDSEAMTGLFLPLLQESPGNASMLLTDLDGNELMLLRRGTRWTRRETRPGREGGAHLLSELGPEGQVRSSERVQLDYDPRTRPWFRNAMEGGGSGLRRPELRWTEPYVFYTTREIGITASMRFRAHDGKQWIVAVDVALSHLREFAASISLERGGRVAILDPDFDLLAATGHGEASEPRLIPARNAGLPWLRDALASLEQASGGPGLEEREAKLFESTSGFWLARAAPFALSQDTRLWMLVAVPGSQLFVQVRRFLWIVVALTLGVLAITSWRVFVIAGRIGRPLERLALGSERISRGQLDEETTCETPYLEIRRLSDAHSRMRVSLRELLTLEDELQLAHQIQAASFPEHLPELEKWEFGAFSAAARETGGDMYDVIGFRRDDESRRLVIDPDAPDEAVLLLADATGHGLGPALSVSQLRAMLRISVRLDAPPAEFFANVNEQLCSDLRSGRFLTAWFGAVDREQDDLFSLSFGQAPILLYRAESGTVECLGADMLPLGIQESLQARAPKRLHMQEGDVCLVVSDGVYETRNPGGEQFGLERLERFLSEGAQLEAQAFASGLRRAVAEFGGGRPAGDDQTAIVVRRRR